jgi:hypothetical protein
MNKQILSCLFLFASVAGCAGFGQIDCLSADWSLVGFEDGESGKPVSDIGDYQEACSAQSSNMDLNAYNEGHEEGVRVYCQPENGFELGQNGAEYSDVCPADLSIAFQQKYIDGSRFYPYYRNIGEREMIILNNTATMGSLHGGIGSASLRMGTPGISESERNQLRQSIDSMHSQIRTLESNNQRLETEIATWATQLRELKTNSGR